MEQLKRSGFAMPERVIHLFVGGSELHGAKVGATDDLDLYGVFIEPPEGVLGLTPLDHYVWSTASDERRNGPEDVDLTLYSLRRWTELAAKGNATGLHFLFAEATANSLPIWQGVQAARGLFLSKRSADQFLGFADNQRQRITGEKGRGAKGQRPEYIGRFGYDTKAAMHCLRLYLECIELMRDSTITLPRPERDYLVAVRGGELTLDQFVTEAQRLEADAVAASQTSRLPEDIDRAALSRLIAKTELAFWRERGELD